jgi:hypothetical protein
MVFMRKIIEEKSHYHDVKCTYSHHDITVVAHLYHLAEAMSVRCVLSGMLHCLWTGYLLYGRLAPLHLFIFSTT